LNAQRLLNTKGVHANTENHPLEDIWQKELYPIITSLVPTENTVSASVGRIFSTEGADVVKSASKGLVDFYIGDNLKWMLEFVSEGSDLGGHLSRFRKKGEYRFIPRKDYLIVDFRSSQKDTRFNDDHVLSVSYSDDFSTLTVSGKPLKNVVNLNSCVVTLATKETLPQTMAILAISKSTSTTTITRKIKKRHTEEQMDITKPDKRKRSTENHEQESKEKEGHVLEKSESKSRSSEEEREKSSESDE